MLRRTAVAGVSLITVVLISAGCSQAALSPAATAAPAVSPPAVSPDVSEAPSPGTSPDEASEGPSSGVAITFDNVKPKRWGAKPFEVKAVASNGAKIKYSAKGVCTVTPRGGRVEIQKVGDCVITAKTTSGEPGLESMTIKVRPAKPKIAFVDDSVRWKPGVSYPLEAKVSPSIPLSYALVKAGSNENCKVRNGTLTLLEETPQLPLECFVKVEAAAKSPNYQTPEPVVAKIIVRYPAWDVEASSPGVVDWSETNGVVRVKVREHSGTALGMTANGAELRDQDLCGASVDSSPSPAPLGTKSYEIVLNVSQPSVQNDTAEGYQCTMLAVAGPENYAGSSGSTDSFTVTVEP